MIRPSVVVLLLLGSATATFAEEQNVRVGPSAVTTQSMASARAPRLDGLTLGSAGGDFRVQLGVLVHADFRFEEDDNPQPPDVFLVRRLRPYVRGEFAHRFEFFLNPDLSKSSPVVVQDLYVDTVLTPRFRIRLGKQKTPFGLERLQSALNLMFLERALPTALVPNRDIGVQVLGELQNGAIGYLGAVMNGVADGGSYEHPTADGKEVSGRFTVRPFNSQTAHPLHGLALALAGRVPESTQTPLRSLRTTTLQQRYFTYASGCLNDGARTRYSPQVTYYRGRFGGFSEYVRTHAPLRRAAVRHEVENHAWQVAGSWVLTGEAATDATTGVRPRMDFEPRAHHWGAVQVATRFHALTVDKDAFTYGLTSAASSRTASAWTSGLNWYLNGNVRCTGEFERTVFDGGSAGARPAERLFAFRTQLLF